MASFQETIDSYNELSPEDQTTFLARLSNNRALKSHNNEIRKVEKDKLYPDIENLKVELREKENSISALQTEVNKYKTQAETAVTANQNVENAALTRFEALLKNQKEDYERQIALQDSRIQQLHVDSLRNKVLHTFQIPENMAKFVIGQTKEELEQSAESVIETFNEMKGSLLSNFKKDYNIEEGSGANSSPQGAENSQEESAPTAAPGPEAVLQPVDPMAPRQLDGVVAGSPDIGQSTTQQFTAQDIASMSASEYAKNRDLILQQRKASLA